MKKLICLLALALLLPISLFSCQSEDTLFSSFRILHIHGDSILAEFVQGTPGLISIGTRHLDDIDIAIGDIFEIEWDGNLRESYPAQLTAISWRMYERAELPSFTAVVISSSGGHARVTKTCNPVVNTVISSSVLHTIPLNPGDVIQAFYTGIDVGSLDGITSIGVDVLGFTIIERSN